MARGSGGGGIPGNLQEIMRQAQQVQAQLLKSREDAAKKEFDSQSGGGAVKIVMTGQYKITSLTLDPKIINPDDKELLEQMIQAAVNEAVNQVESHMKQELEKATGGINLPGLF